MTTTTSIRDEAEHHLRALVGRDDARLHDDQWAAIEALVVEQSRPGGASRRSTSSPPP
jgi:ATP-dependent DNA helicase RecQ